MSFQWLCQPDLPWCYQSLCPQQRMELWSKPGHSHDEGRRQLLRRPCHCGQSQASKCRPNIVKGFWQGDEMPCKILKDKIKTLGLIFLPYHHIGWVLCQPVPPWQWPQGSLWSWIWSGHCPHRRMAPGLLMDLSWLPRDLQPGVRWIGTTIMGTVLDDSPFPPLHKHNIGHSFPCPVQSSFWKFPWQAHNREPRYRTPRKLSWFQNSIL